MPIVQAYRSTPHPMLAEDKDRPICSLHFEAPSQHNFGVRCHGGGRDEGCLLACLLICLFVPFAQRMSRSSPPLSMVRKPHIYLREEVCPIKP